MNSFVNSRIVKKLVLSFFAITALGGLIIANVNPVVAGYLEIKTPIPLPVVIKEQRQSLRLIISLKDQKADLYSGLNLIESQRVSTGKIGHETPAGIYSILEKKRFHESNIYSDAPMPFMQRLTRSGIALHKGHVPYYPASHGCIRLPGEFAERLFSLTEIGTDVVVVRDSGSFQKIEHKKLPSPYFPGTQKLASISTSEAHAASLSMADIESELDQFRSFEQRSDKPLRILIARPTLREKVIDIQNQLYYLGYLPNKADGIFGSRTQKAIARFQKDHGYRPTGTFSDQIIERLHKASGNRAPTAHIYVKQDTKDLFHGIARFKNPKRPIGTHMYVLNSVDSSSGKTQWMSLSLDKGTKPFSEKQKQPWHATTAKMALERIEIPEEISKRIAPLLTEGSTFIISDNGRGKETSSDTNFIVEPREQ